MKVRKLNVDYCMELMELNFSALDQYAPNLLYFRLTNYCFTNMEILLLKIYTGSEKVQFAPFIRNVTVIT